jgi:hypothetical protein
MSDRVYEILFGAAIVLCIVLTVKYLWPLILVIALLIAAGIWRTKHLVSKAEKEARDAMQEEETEEEQDVPQYEQDLFQEQVQKAHAEQRRPEGDIIDAEFTRKEPEQPASGKETH